MMRQLISSFASARIGRQAATLATSSASSTSSSSSSLSMVMASRRFPQQQLLASFSSSSPSTTMASPENDTNTTTVTTINNNETPKIVIELPDGRTFSLPDSRKLPKVKPSIIRQRLDKLKTYVGTEKNIRHSPWRLNLICQMIAGMPVEEALEQLDFCEKSRAPLVKKVLQTTVELADKRDALQPSQLEIAECFVTKATPLKRMKPMARGRFGKMTRQHAHMRLVLREIDFKLRIYQQPSVNQKKKWLQLFLRAQQDGEKAMAERRELEELEAKQRELKEKKQTEQK